MSHKPMNDASKPLVEVNNLGFSRGKHVTYEDGSLSIPRG